MLIGIVFSELLESNAPTPNLASTLDDTLLKFLHALTIKTRCVQRSSSKMQFVETLKGSKRSFIETNIEGAWTAF